HTGNITVHGAWGYRYGDLGTIFRCDSVLGASCIGTGDANLLVQSNNINHLTDYSINTSIEINRTLSSSYLATSVNWVDSSSNASCMATYNLTGLNVLDTLSIFDNEVEIGVSPLSTDVAGALPIFSLTLSSPHDVSVLKLSFMILSSQPANNSALPCGATNTTLIVTTYGSGECRYSTSPDLDFSSMTVFNNTNSTTHDSIISGIQNDQSYDYYVKCQNAENASEITGDYHIHFISLDNTWLYKREINITENSGNDLTDYQVELIIDTQLLISEGKMQADCDDIRFTGSDTLTELSYWLESDCNTINTKVWVKANLSASSNTTVYMYYGNSCVGSESNGTAIFELFDDFEDGDHNTWTYFTFNGGSSSVGVSDTGIKGVKSVEVYDAGGPSNDAGGGIYKSFTPSDGKKYTAWIKNSNVGANYRPDGIVLYDATDGITETSHTSLSFDNGNIRWASGGSELIFGSISSNTWYLFEFYFHDSNKVDINVYGNNLDLLYSATNKSYDSGIDRIAITNVKGTVGANFIFVDTISVRKYTSPEPTLTLGSEAQNVADGCTDNDGDGYGAEGTNLSQCTNSIILSDCNDSNANVHPGAADIPSNGIDEDCSGDDNVVSFEVYLDFIEQSAAGTYYVGDDVDYQITFKVDDVASDESLDDLKIELTDSRLNVLKTQYLTDLTRQSAGVYTGTFTSEDLTAYPSNQGIRLTAYAYDSLDNLLNSGIHASQFLLDGTTPLLTSTTYTYLTDAPSNHTVKDLAVNSSFVKVDWTGTTLDLHARDIDLDSALIIDNRSAYLDSAAYSELNNSAVLTFYYVDCASPYVFYSETENTRAAILAENKQCLPPRCTNIECSESTLTVTVSSFTGYAVEADANLTIDADDPALLGEEVHFTADYRDVSDNSFISGANCTIYFTDENYPMVEGTVYTYNRTFITGGLKDYNVTCSKAGFSTLTAFDNATIGSVEIPEFSIITFGLGLIAVLAGLIVIRKRR
ncbi:MAG: DUF2341 domain-containing protein, partial [Nanoarchaeota archaeon]|nr:DUF2341 domain-containing protein [Nanoarchaeota archaeon]